MHLNHEATKKQPSVGSLGALSRSVEVCGTCDDGPHVLFFSANALCMELLQPRRTIAKRVSSFKA